MVVPEEMQQDAAAATHGVLPSGDLVLVARTGERVSADFRVLEVLTPGLVAQASRSETGLFEIYFPHAEVAELQDLLAAAALGTGYLQTHDEVMGTESLAKVLKLTASAGGESLLGAATIVAQGVVPLSGPSSLIALYGAMDHGSSAAHGNAARQKVADEACARAASDIEVAAASPAFQTLKPQQIAAVLAKTPPRRPFLTMEAESTIIGFCEEYFESPHHSTSSGTFFICTKVCRQPFGKPPALEVAVVCSREMEHESLLWACDLAVGPYCFRAVATWPQPGGKESCIRRVIRDPSICGCQPGMKGSVRLRATVFQTAAQRRTDALGAWLLPWATLDERRDSFALFHEIRRRLAASKDIPSDEALGWQKLDHFIQKYSELLRPTTCLSSFRRHATLKPDKRLVSSATATANPKGISIDWRLN